MKNVIGLLGAAVLAAWTARADFGYLHFLVDESKTIEPIAFEYARVGVKGADAYLNLAGTTSSWLAGDGSGLATTANYAALGAYDDAQYSFYVALYDADFNNVGISEAVGYEALSQYIYRDMEQSGVDATWTVSSFTAVPEPSGGLLVLLGAAVLALRRRRGQGRASEDEGGSEGGGALPALGGRAGEDARATLLRHLCVILVFAAGNVFGAANDTLLAFSSTGPDRYADGSVVQDGECYALVWTRKGATFGGLDAEGKPVSADSRVLVFAPVAKGGRCPTVVFEVDAALAATYADGAYALYLLDTRLATGRVGGLAAKGTPVAVNGYGKVTAEVASASAGGVCANVSTAVPTDAPKPVVKDLKVIGGQVYMTVSGTLPCLQYVVQGGETPDAASLKTIGTPANGKAGEDLILVAPATGSSGFFKVGRK